MSAKPLIHVEGKKKKKKENQAKKIASKYIYVRLLF